MVAEIAKRLTIPEDLSLIKQVIETNMVARMLGCYIYYEFKALSSELVKSLSWLPFGVVITEFKTILHLLEYSQ